MLLLLVLATLTRIPLPASGNNPPHPFALYKHVPPRPFHLRQRSYQQ